MSLHTSSLSSPSEPPPAFSRDADTMTLLLPSGCNYAGRKAAYKAVFQENEHGGEDKKGSYRHCHEGGGIGNIGWRERLLAEQRSERRAQILEDLRSRSLSELRRIAELHGGGRQEDTHASCVRYHEYQYDDGRISGGSEREREGVDSWRLETDNTRGLLVEEMNGDNRYSATSRILQQDEGEREEETIDEAEALMKAGLPTSFGSEKSQRNNKGMWWDKKKKKKKNRQSQFEGDPPFCRDENMNTGHLETTSMSRTEEPWIHADEEMPREVHGEVSTEGTWNFDALGKARDGEGGRSVSQEGGMSVPCDKEDIRSPDKKHEERTGRRPCGGRSRRGGTRVRKGHPSSTPVSGFASLIAIPTPIVVPEDDQNNEFSSSLSKCLPGFGSADADDWYVYLRPEGRRCLLVMNQGMGAVIDKRGIVRGLLNPFPVHQSFEEKQKQHLAEFHTKHTSMHEDDHTTSLPTSSLRSSDGLGGREESFKASGLADETLSHSHDGGEDYVGRGTSLAHDVSMDLDPSASLPLHPFDLKKSNLPTGRRSVHQRDVTGISESADHVFTTHLGCASGSPSSSSQTSSIRSQEGGGARPPIHGNLKSSANSFQPLSGWETCPRCLRSWCTSSWGSCARGFTALECVWMNSHDLRWDEELHKQRSIDDVRQQQQQHDNEEMSRTCSAPRAEIQTEETGGDNGTGAAAGSTSERSLVIQGQQPRRKVLELMMTRSLGPNTTDDPGCQCCCSSFLFVTDVLWWSDCMLGQAETMCRHFFLKSRFEEAGEDLSGLQLLPMRECNLATLSELYYYSNLQPWPTDSFVFVHREAPYIEGLSDFWLSWRDAHLSRFHVDEIRARGGKAALQAPHCICLRLNGDDQLVTEDNVVLGSISDQDGLSERLRKPGHLLRCSIDRVVFSVQEPKAVSVEGLRVLSRVSSKVRRQADALARIVDQFLKRSAEESHQRSLPATAMKPAGSLAFNRLCKFLFGEKQTGLRGTPWPIANPSESLAID